MTKEELLTKLTALRTSGDPEDAHCEADDLLVEYINDPDIAEAYGDVPKWYA